jgi:hypothetical protein
LIQSTSISRIGSDTEFAGTISESAIRSPPGLSNEFYSFKLLCFPVSSAHPRVLNEVLS